MFWVSWIVYPYCFVLCGHVLNTVGFMFLYISFRISSYFEGWRSFEIYGQGGNKINWFLILVHFLLCSEWLFSLPGKNWQVSVISWVSYVYFCCKNGPITLTCLTEWLLKKYYIIKSESPRLTGALWLIFSVLEVVTGLLKSQTIFKVRRVFLHSIHMFTLWKSREKF